MSNAQNTISVVPAFAGFFDDNQIKTLEQGGIIPAQTPPQQIQLFGAICREHELSPLTKEIYLIGYGGKYSVVVGIDGLRKKAARTGAFAGRDDAKFDVMPDGTHKTAAQLKAENKLPVSCTVTVYRVVSGLRVPFTKTVLLSEYKGKTGKWNEMPFNMLEKCAEAAAIRTAFADQVAGLHIQEESASITGEVITVQNSSAIPENVQNAIFDTNAFFDGKPDSESVLNFYANVMKSSSDNLNYIQYVGTIVENTLSHVADMEKFAVVFRALSKRWQDDMTIRKLFSERRKQIENAATN